MRNLILVAALPLALSACGNPAQTAASTAAAIDAGACVLTLAPPVMAVAQSGGSDTQKAISAATVAFRAGAASSNCPAVATDVATAIQAGKVTAPAVVQ